MGILTEMIVKADIIERTFSPNDEMEERPDLRLQRLKDQLAKIDSDHYSLRLLSAGGNALGKSLLKQKIGREAATALCDLLLFARQNDIDLETALQDYWHRQLSNKYG